ncbi:hypothetical protein [Chlorogloeopsis sp. ULAP02]
MVNYVALRCRGCCPSFEIRGLPETSFSRTQDDGSAIALLIVALF